MNKKINVIALAAAACGAFALTSCGGGKTHIVLFRTDGLRNVTDHTSPTLVKVKAQTVKDGGYAKSPINTLDTKGKFGRYTYSNKGTTTELIDEALPLKGWSESTEDETGGQYSREFVLSTTPITSDTVLYPIYSEEKVHCITLNLKENNNTVGTWFDSANSKHVWAENWFVDGTKLDNFDEIINPLVNCPNNTEIEYWTIKSETESGKQEKFVFEGKVISEDIALTAHYKNKSA